MATATYTLASAGTFTDSRTGIPAHFNAGTYPLDLAVLYGMPGAEAPAEPDPFSTEQVAYLGDSYRSSRSNLVGNGGFAGHAGDWTADQDGVAIAHDGEASRLAVGGSLSVTVPANDGGSPALGTSYRPGGAGAVSLDGLGEIDAVCYARSDDTTAKVFLTVAFYGDGDASDFVSSVDGAETAALDATHWTACAIRHLPVPAGATHARLTVRVSVADGDDPVAFDDVYLGAPYGDVGPYADADATDFPANRLVGGDFADGIDAAWSGNQGDETLTADAGALKVVTLGGDVEEGVFYAANGYTVVRAGETVRLAFRAKGAGVVLDVWRGWKFPNANAVIDTITLGAAFAPYHYDLTVPAGKQFVVLGFWTSDDHAEQAATFWLDDVTLGTPA